MSPLLAPYHKHCFDHKNAGVAFLSIDPTGASPYECDNVLACQNHDKSQLYDIGSSTVPPGFTSIDNG